MSRWVPVGGGGTAGTDSRLGGARRQCCWGERLSGSYGSLLCFLLICIIVVPVFPLFAVLLNCPYPYPPVSASFFSFSSARRRGEGRPRGSFVADGIRNQNTPEQVQDPDKLVKYLQKLCCHPWNSRETQITAKCWSLAHRATVLNLIQCLKGERGGSEAAGTATGTASPASPAAPPAQQAVTDP